ncbi:hypothetical protein GW746_01215, partial [Candidatus Saccharibacteria bacterium]|nr:hypothetical protein [Candidatus Saccharibacteria bacterium]
MDEDRNQTRARDKDEETTQQRAAILGIPYLDTRQIESTLPLIKDVLDVDIMHRNRILPLVAGGDSAAWQFGITTQSPQSAMKELREKYTALAQNV